MGLGTVLVTIAYFAYGTAFVPPPGEIEPAPSPPPILLAIGLAWLAFAGVGLVSGIDRVLRRSLIAVGVLVLVALVLGLLTPLFGAAAGLGTGVSLALNQPEVDNVLRNRIVAVALAAAYTLVLLVVITPAGVLTGALLPPIMVGFADEFSAWRAYKTRL